MQTDAVEVAGRPARDTLLFTCEHASNRVPAPWRPNAADRALLRMHWGYDIGARDLTRALVRRSEGVGVLSRFSRLLCDPNRAPDDPTLVLRACDDGVPSFNAQVDVAARVDRFHRPFHDALHDVVARTRPRFLVSVHSFTPVFRGHARPMEAGVLFDRHDDHAERLLGALRAAGLNAASNEPYSGKDGLIYSAARHGAAHDVPYLEIEVRQDLIATPAQAEAVADRVWTALVAMGL